MSVGSLFRIINWLSLYYSHKSETYNNIYNNNISLIIWFINIILELETIIDNHIELKNELWEIHLVKKVIIH